MSKKDMFIAIMLNVVWGGSFTFAGYAVLFYAPLFLYALRFLSTGLITAPINRAPLSKIPLLKIIGVRLFILMLKWFIFDYFELFIILSLLIRKLIVLSNIN